MPVRNAGEWLDEAVRSILNQTFRNLELVVVDDGSSDGSPELLQEYARADGRIRLHRLARSQGIVNALNEGLGQCRAPLVARMDGDDVSHPDRLQKQMAALRSNPSVLLLGTLWEGIDGSGRVVRKTVESRIQSPFPPFPHGSILFRRDAAASIGGYRNECLRWEDADFYWRMGRLGPAAFLAEPLYRYRFHRANTQRDIDDEQIRSFAVMLHAASRVAVGLDYALGDSGPLANARTYALHALTSHSIMAGLRPGTIGALLRNGRLDLYGLKVAVESIAGELHPRLARWLMNRFSAMPPQASRPALRMWSYLAGERSDDRVRAVHPGTR